MIFIRGQKGVSRRGVFFIPELSFHMEGKVRAILSFVIEL